MPHYENVPFEVPEGWVWTTINELCDVVRGGSPRPAGDEKYYNGAIPFLKVADLTKDDGIYVYKAEYTIKEAGLKKTRLVNEGTLLLTNSGATLGVPKITTFPTTFNDGIAAFLYMNREVQLYLYWFIKSKTDSLRKIDQGAAQPNLNTDLIKSIPIPLPPLTEQFRIIKEIEHWFALIDQIEQDKADLQTIIKQTKSKILDLAIHGKLVPQAPNDEPAIELLKRINPDFTPCDNGHYTQLPDGWSMCKMKQITNIINGKSQKNVETSNGIYPIYGSGGVIGRSNQYLCIAGSTIIGRKGTINNPIFVEEHFWNVDTAFGLKANDALLDKYLYYFCLSFDFSKLDKSTAMPSLTKASIGDVLIPIPPYQEQKRIITKIDTVLDSMNEIMESL